MIFVVNFWAEILTCVRFFFLSSKAMIFVVNFWAEILTCDQVSASRKIEVCGSPEFYSFDSTDSTRLTRLTRLDSTRLDSTRLDSTRLD